MTMSKPDMPVDYRERLRALEPGKSFIVQAPAGSGKTGLLTQRYLMLLATVESPEEIVAITFTRKAAGEMRDRILKALRAAQGDPPKKSYELQTWELARKALQQDSRQGWNLLSNPGRLGIQTIDSLCQSLVRQMPLLSHFGAVPMVTEDARPLYLEAADSVFAQLESDDDLQQPITQLLRHRDNRVDELQNLIADMLERRDQWLRHVAPHALDIVDASTRRADIEHVLQSLVEEALVRARQAIPGDLAQVLPTLASFAAENVKDSSDIRHCAGMTEIPGSNYTGLQQWQGIASLLQTGNGNKARWRKPGGVNINIGFPKPGDGKTPEQQALFNEHKQRMQDLLESLQDELEFRDCLAALEMLPAPLYSDDEWELLDDLFRLLVHAVAHLKTVFTRHGKVDFSEMALSADEALGDEEEPTDLSLRLDYRLSHLLVDEFQDTSQNQFMLFRKLVAGWSAGDGRTVFLVGDPMQSIYRFREAEVGLFLQAWEGRLGNVPLEPLRLSVNFRSQQGIIDWVNEAFPYIFPAADDKVSGAVSYTASAADKPRIEGDATVLHPYYQRDDEAEASDVVEIVREARAQSPGGNIAILTRSKAHVAHIVHRLTEQGLRFQAVELIGLSQRPVIQDLLALSCGLLHLADRISWLAMLRSPWCGLCLADLFALAGQADKRVIMDLLNDEACVERLSVDGRRRIERVLPVLNTVLQQRGRQPLRLWLEGAWIALGGPAGVNDDTDLEDAAVFFLLLQEIDESSEPVTGEQLHSRIEKLFARPDVHADANIQIMTMHKAKGLEFDTVILPGLGKVTGRDSARLLYWLERTGRSGEPELVYGPIRATQEEKNRTADYIRKLEQDKARLENGRLLYVAATRAKKRLHLFGHVEVDEDSQQLKPPPADSLLASLWPAVENEFIQCYEAREELAIDEVEANVDVQRPGLRRLATDWQCPAPEPGIVGSGEIETESELPLEFDWASQTARLTGTVVHRLLEQLAGTGDESSADEEIARLSRHGRRMLQQVGLPREHRQEAARRVEQALMGVLDDDRGRWILSQMHDGVRSEYPVSHVVDGKVSHLVIDRTFVDKQGTRWIIDYKTGSHAGGGLEEFLDREQQRYQPQMEKYARAMSSMENRRIMLALYFPLMQGWRAWEYPGNK
jgi:ATP-dependent helicase/nuclease subunit A